MNEMGLYYNFQSFISVRPLHVFSSDVSFVNECGEVEGFCVARGLESGASEMMGLSRGGCCYTNDEGVVTSILG